MDRLLHISYYVLLLTVHQCWPYYPYLIDEKTIHLSCLWRLGSCELSTYSATFSECMQAVGLALELALCLLCESEPSSPPLCPKP